MSSGEGLAKRSRDPQEVGQPDETDKKYMAKSYRAVSEIAKKPGVASLAVAVAIPFIAGIIDGAVNSPNNQWYKDLKKPFWNPPGFLFGAAWSILYPLMGLASWLVWTKGGLQKQGYPLALYAVQLVLNLLWPVFFFGKHNVGLALIDIVALAGVLVLMIAAFKPVNHVAANLMKGYLAWVLFAAALTINIFFKNRGGTTAVAEQHAE